MTTPNRAYVLATFQNLIANCQNNVLMGLRIVERVNALPPPTPEELQFLQLSFDGPPTEFEKSRSLFKRWILLNGFKDVHTSIRVVLERLFVFDVVEREIRRGSNINVDEFERELLENMTKFYFPQLVAEVGSLFHGPFKYLKHAESFNAARNCLEHTKGVVTQRHCNNLAKDKLIIHGNRFKMFFKKDNVFKRSR